MTHLAVSFLLTLLAVLSVTVIGSRDISGDVIRLPSEASRFFRSGATNDDDDAVGTRWAVLIAGSNGYWNYRHQADVCHAYQLLIRGGLKEENIVVFMYDDIASNEENPRPGIVINSPHGSDVYKGVPKDYTGEDVTVKNFLAAILGNKTAITGGSGKVVDSGPNDHIFIFYAGHGTYGLLGMPTGPDLSADDLIDVLKIKHASGTYKSLVFYLEACHSGSIFEDLLPDGLNIYATTASNAEESSWGTYCPWKGLGFPSEYKICLGALYSVAWMEDSEIHNLRTETLHQQYELVKKRTAKGNFGVGSHVMLYGDIGLGKENLFLYIGTDPANDRYTFVSENSLRPPSKDIKQHDANLMYFWYKYCEAPEGSTRKVDAQKQFVELISHRVHLDYSIKLIGKILFGTDLGPEILNTDRDAGKPVVDDWACLKSLVRTFEMHCGSLSQYGMTHMQHMRAIANICNAGIREDIMAEASALACDKG